MKKIFTLYLIILSYTAFSQPTLLSTEMAMPGTVFTYKHVGSFTAIDTTLQGPNQTWDFSSVPNTLDPDYVNEIIDPTTFGFTDSFPTANWGILEDGTDFSFFHLSNSLMERVGSYNSMDGYTYYTDTQIEYLFPMILGTGNVDLSTNVNNGSISDGTYTFDCIGTGTLLAPGHTYNNVILSRVVLDVFIFHIISYIWYDADNGMPVFDYIPGDGVFIPEAAIYLNSVTTKIDKNEFASGLRINNPVSTKLNVSLYSENPSTLSYDLRNMLGEVVTSGVIEKNQFQYLHLDMESNQAGLYIFSVRDVDNTGHIRTIKIIKQ